MNDLFSARRVPEIVDYIAKDIQFVAPTGAWSGKDAFIHIHPALLLERPDLVLTFTPASLQYTQLWQFAYIGRASFRERVCHAVSTPLVAVLLQNKHLTTNS